MGFNLSTFRCGQTLQDTDLNAIVNAINSIYNAQGIYIDSNSNSIKLTDNSNGNITKSELQTFLGISGSNEDYIPISGSDDISGNLIPDGSDNYNLGDESNYWKDIYTSTEHAKILKFHSQQQTYESLGELYVGKDTSNNNEIILHFKHGNDNEEIVATRDWVNSQLNPSSISIGSTGSISEEQYNDKSNYIKIESSSDNPIVIAGYDENSLPTGIKFGDASTGDVLTVYNEKIYINGDLFGGENGVSVLNDLSNVDASAARTGQFLMYNGKHWVNDDLPESQIIHPGDVSRNEEYYLKYEVDDEHPSGWYSWVERPSGAKELNELNDVEINDTKLELGQVLVYSQVTDEENNTCNSWVNKTVSGVLTYNQDDHDKYLRVKSNGTGTEWVSGVTTGVSSINNITGDVTITGSGVSTNNNTITITGGGLTSGSWASYFDGKTKGEMTPISGQYLKWDSDGNLTQDSGSYTLNKATDSALGGIKTGYTTNANDKNYKVQVDNNGNAYVNVPWTASNQTLSGLIGSSSIGGQTTPIYWDGSAFQTCNTQTSGITSISVGTASQSLTPSSGSVTIPSLTSSNSTEYGVIKANGSFNAPNYPVKTNNSGSAYITLAIDDLMGSNAVGSSTTPIYWTGSAFSTCSTSTGGVSADVFKQSIAQLCKSISLSESMIVFPSFIDNTFTFQTIKEFNRGASSSPSTGYFVYKGVVSDAYNLGDTIADMLFYKNYNQITLVRINGAPGDTNHVGSYARFGWESNDNFTGTLGSDHLVGVSPAQPGSFSDNGQGVLNKIKSILINDYFFTSSLTINTNNIQQLNYSDRNSIISNIKFFIKPSLTTSNNP